MTNKDRTERIFLTAKTRMIAEERARSLNAFLNGLTAWYAFCLIAASVANLAGALSHGIIEFSSTLLSIAVFGVSLFLLGGRISQRAEDHRRCYLALKSIYHSSSSDAEKMAAYDSELEKYPNHKPIDYDLMIAAASSRNQELWNDEGKVELTEAISKRVGWFKKKQTASAFAALILPAILFTVAYTLSSTPTDAQNLSKEQTAD